MFHKMEPLAARRRKKRKLFALRDSIQKAVTIFDHALEVAGIKLRIAGDENLAITGWPEDIHVTFANLIENSIHWFSGKTGDDKRILISFEKDDDQILVEYRDNGPGIAKDLLKEDLIFEPGISGKPEGTGLGLAIAGEAIERNGGKIWAPESSSGAIFRIQLPINK